MEMFDIFEGEEAKVTTTSYESSESVHELAARRFSERAHAHGQVALFDVNISTGEVTFPEEIL